MRRTKIVATVGPASSDAETLGQLIRAGVDVFRLNYSHGARESHTETLDRIRAAAADTGREIGILQDLSGPKIRTGPLENADTLPMEEGAEWILVGEEGPVRPGRLTSTLPELVDELEPEQRVLIKDGRIELVVIGRGDDGVRMRVVRGGLLTGKAGINLPTTRLSVPAMTEKDRGDLEAGLDAGADMTALSFVREADDLEGPRRIASRSGIAHRCSRRIIAAAESFGMSSMTSITITTAIPISGMLRSTSWKLHPITG